MRSVAFSHIVQSNFRLKRTWNNSFIKKDIHWFEGEKTKQLWILNEWDVLTLQTSLSGIRQRSAWRNLLRSHRIYNIWWKCPPRHSSDTHISPIYCRLFFTIVCWCQIQFCVKNVSFYVSTKKNYRVLKGVFSRCVWTAVKVRLGKFWDKIQTRQWHKEMRDLHFLWKTRNSDFILQDIFM